MGFATGLYLPIVKHLEAQEVISLKTGPLFGGHFIFKKKKILFVHILLALRLRFILSDPGHMLVLYMSVLIWITVHSANN